jgi:hypothetical protein
VFDCEILCGQFSQVIKHKTPELLPKGKTGVLCVSICSYQI